MRNALCATVVLLVFLAGLVGIGKSLDGTYRHYENKGFNAGQCSQMDWDLQTHSLKPNDEKVTQKVYDELCQNKN